MNFRVQNISNLNDITSSSTSREQHEDHSPRREHHQYSAPPRWCSNLQALAKTALPRCAPDKQFNNLAQWTCLFPEVVEPQQLKQTLFTFAVAFNNEMWFLLVMVIHMVDESITYYTPLRLKKQPGQLFPLITFCLALLGVISL